MQKNEYLKEKEYLIKEGIGYSGMFSFGDSFLPAFALFLGASNEFIGLFSTLPSLIGAITQVFAPYIAKIYKKTKTIVCLGILSNVVFWLFLAILPFIWGNLILLILCVILYTAINWFINPLWASWVGEVIKRKEVGTFFGKRASAKNLTYVVTAITAGIIMNFFQKNPIIGFSIIFILAALFRFYSYINMKKIKERKINYEIHNPIKVLNSNENLKIFYIFISLFYLATYIASPFFVVFQLKILKLNYFLFSILILTPPLIKFMASKYWGKMIDRYGSKTNLFAGAFLAALVPLIYYFSNSIIELFLANIISGFAWAAIEIASLTYILKNSKKEERAERIATSNLFYGISVFIGGLIGAYISAKNLMLVFLVSGIFRMIISTCFLFLVYEHKSTIKRKLNAILLLVGFKSITHALFDFRHYSIELIHKIKK